MNMGIILYKRGALRDALFYFEKAVELGIEQGTQYIAAIREELGIESNAQDDPV